MINQNQQIEGGNLQEKIFQGAFFALIRMSKNVDVDDQHEQIANDADAEENHRDQKGVEFGTIDVFVGAERSVIVVLECPILPHLHRANDVGGRRAILRLLFSVCRCSRTGRINFLFDQGSKNIQRCAAFVLIRLQ